jgi:hypothetical protein
MHQLCKVVARAPNVLPDAAARYHNRYPTLPKVGKSRVKRVQQLCAEGIPALRIAGRQARDPFIHNIDFTVNVDAFGAFIA